MRVKELLLAALSRANHIEDGTSADARELNKARNYFNSSLSTYSDSNLITAFQRVTEVTGKPEQVLGKYNLKRGKVMYRAKTLAGLPDPTRLDDAKDYGEYGEGDDRNLATIQKIHREGEHGEEWDEIFWMPVASNLSFEEKLTKLGICDYVPDVVVSDIERIVGVMVKPKDCDGPYRDLKFVPLTSFYTDDGTDIYCSQPRGDNKALLLLPEELTGCSVKVVYNTSMKFGNDDYIELPEVYRELLTLSVAVGLLSEDADSDPTQLNNYSKMLEKLEHQIGANNVNTRRIVRKDERLIRPLYSGQFICRR